MWRGSQEEICDLSIVYLEKYKKCEKKKIKIKMTELRNKKIRSFLIAY